MPPLKPSGSIGYKLEHYPLLTPEEKTQGRAEGERERRWRAARPGLRFGGDVALGWDVMPRSELKLVPGSAGTNGKTSNPNGKYRQHQRREEEGRVERMWERLGGWRREPCGPEPACRRGCWERSPPPRIRGAAGRRWRGGGSRRGGDPGPPTSALAYSPRGPRRARSHRSAPGAVPWSCICTRNADVAVRLGCPWRRQLPGGLPRRRPRRNDRATAAKRRTAAELQPGNPFAWIPPSWIQGNWRPAEGGGGGRCRRPTGRSMIGGARGTPRARVSSAPRLRCPGGCWTQSICGRGLGRQGPPAPPILSQGGKGTATYPSHPMWSVGGADPKARSFLLPLNIL